MPLIDNYLLDNYAIDGPVTDAPLKLLGSGSTTASSSTLPIVRFDTREAWAGQYYVQVSGRNFGYVPKFIIFKRGTTTDSMYARDLKNSFGDSFSAAGSAFSAVTGTEFYATETSFKLPVLVNGGSYTWEAYG